MELILPENYVEGGEQMTAFGLDTGIAMLMLRQKIYADSKRAVVQEYMSNARDANREAGRGHVPITVRFPTLDSVDMTFEDNGPGITPDRMQNVFTHYGKSTKRNSNNQTGGWGLGCKAGFSIADSFRVETVWEDADGAKREAIYMMAIDASQKNVWTCLSQSELPPETPTGTKICIPVDEEDIEYFIECAISVGHYWGHPAVADSAYPNIYASRTGGYGRTYRYLSCESTVFPAPEFPDHIPGSLWQDCSFGRGVPGLVLDGIQYALRSDQLGDDKFTRNERGTVAKLALFFSTGELAVTATREDIDYSSVTTLVALRDKLTSVYAGYLDQIKLSLKSLPYWECSWKLITEYRDELYRQAVEGFIWEDPVTKVQRTPSKFRELSHPSYGNSRIPWAQRVAVDQHWVDAPVWDGWSKVTVSRISPCDFDRNPKGYYEDSNYARQFPINSAYDRKNKVKTVVYVDVKVPYSHIRGALCDNEDGVYVVTPDQLSGSPKTRKDAPAAPTYESFRSYMQDELGIDWIQIKPASSFVRLPPPKPSEWYEAQRKERAERAELKKTRHPLRMVELTYGHGPNYSEEQERGDTGRFTSSKNGGVYVYYKNREYFHDRECLRKVDFSLYRAPTGNPQSVQSANSFKVWAMYAHSLREENYQEVINNPNWITLEQWAEVKEERLLRNELIPAALTYSHDGIKCLSEWIGSYGTYFRSDHFREFIIPRSHPLAKSFRFYAESRRCVVGGEKTDTGSHSATVTIRRALHSRNNKSVQGRLGNAQKQSRRNILPYAETYRSMGGRNVGPYFTEFHTQKHALSKALRDSFPLMRFISLDASDATPSTVKEIRKYTHAH